MNLNSLIEKLNQMQVDDWWNNVAPEIASKKAESENWKYYLYKKGKKLPFKWSINHLSRHYNLSDEKITTDQKNRNQFCKEFNFSIKEKLVYDNTKKQVFINNYNKNIKNKELFQLFINYSAQLITKLGIKPYNIRMAIKSQGDNIIIVGMNTILSYKEKNGISILGFMLDKPTVDTLKLEYKLDAYNFKDDGLNITSFEISSVNEFIKLTEKIQSTNEQLIDNHYIKTTKSKLVDWNKEAGTTNDAFKFLVFKNENIKDWVEENKMGDKKFKEIVEKIKEKSKESIVLREFKFNDTNDGWVWIKDNFNTIGNELAHYEIRETYNKITIAVHFEDENKNVFHEAISVLPDKLKWIEWRKSKSIEFEERFKTNSTTLIQDVVTALEWVETKIGNKLREIINNMDKQNTKKKIPSLNQILYGPPGTGKTYSTIDKVVQICSDQFLEKDHEHNKEIFDQLVNDGQVVFTTFHQSMGYEDFVEGIKPKLDKAELSYKNEKGVFGALCESINDQIVEDYNSKYSSSDSISLNFDDQFRLFTKAIEKDTIRLKTKNGIDVQLDEITSNGNIKLTTEGSNSYLISRNRLKKLVDKFENPNEINNSNTSFREVIGGCNSSLYYAALVSFVSWVASIKNVENVMQLNINDIKLTKQETTRLKPHVLIIDEINRGNVSAIFGELITLLEEDKRFGKPNQLSINLTYSKEKLFVPPNLYIIGTMNTADRSVEALDTALRRRFTFEEMMPLYDSDLFNTIENLDVNLEDLLKTINERIEVLLDRDHTIGHSYFMNINTQEELKRVFKDKIIPLLQEYFFGDYGKIGLVLGKSFVKEVNKDGENKKVTFANFQYERSHDLNISYYKLIPVNENFDLNQALGNLMNSKIQAKGE